MPNIHAINAQGTEYGITAENGITQAQVAKIGTIGNASELATENKQTLVGAINEVYTPTSKPAPSYSIEQGVSADYVYLHLMTEIGKVCFLTIDITNVSGANIGGYGTQDFLHTSLRLADTVSCYAQDYKSGAMARFIFYPNGDIQIGESVDVPSGNNEFRFTAIFPLA